MRKVLIALGSNTKQTYNIGKAKVALSEMFEDIFFTDEVWTKPIGVDSDMYLNGLASFTTSLTKKEVLKQLKNIELALGDSHQNHQKGIVLIDIDLIEWGEEKVKPIVWLNSEE